MTIQQLSRSEILERAQQIRDSAPVGIPHQFSKEEGDILSAADSIVRERSATGIGAIVESAIRAVAGERRAAEIALQKTRQREAEIEAALANQETNKKAITREREALERLKNLAETHSRASSADALKVAMEARFWARHEPRLWDHLVEAVKGVQTARDVAAGIPILIEMTESEINRLETDAKAIAARIKK